MRRFTMLVVLGMVTATLALRAGAQTMYYVATCGDDSWSGLTDVCQAPDGPKATIQSAVDVASNGDTVLVLPGIYGQFNLGKSLTITSTDGPDQTSLTHMGTCCSQQYVIYVTADAQIEGFTIEDYDLGNWEYAAVTIRDANPVFINCMFEDCITDYWGQPGQGGAVHAQGGSARFEDCQFLRCYAFGEHGGGYAGAYGGAVYADGTDLVFERCSFVDNSSRDGGAIYAKNGTLHVEQCEFVGNRAIINGDTWDGGSGGAISCRTNPALIVDSVFVGNTGSLSGGAISGSGAIIERCTFSGNSGGSSYSPVMGSPSVVSAGSIIQCTFSANIVWDGDQYPGYLASGQILSSTFYGNEARGTSVICKPFGGENIVIYGNTGTPIEADRDVTYSNIEGGYQGEGNIDADPMFVDAAGGDYRLGAGSPSIDAGNNFGVPLGLTVDLAGQPRFRNDPATTDTGAGVARVVDMGAYEFQAGAFCGADFNDDGASNTIDVLAFLNAWVAEDPTADINADGTINTQDVLAFLNLWNAGC